MRKSWISDAFIALATSLFVGAAYYFPGLFPIFDGLELKFYDYRAQLRQNLDPAPEIALIAVDDASLAELGRWPWPRSRIAALVEKLAQAQPKVIGLGFDYSEPEQSQGLAEIAKLESEYHDMLKSRAVVDKGGKFSILFSSAARALDSDAKLAAALKLSGNVVLPVVMAPGQGATLKAFPPIPPLAEAALGVGHVMVDVEEDGVVRREPLIAAYGGSYLPSYALRLAWSFLGIKPEQARLVRGHELRFGRRTIAMDEEQRMLITFSGPAQTFRYYSFQDVMADRVPMDIFKEKIVLVGLTAAGSGEFAASPLSRRLPRLELCASAVENIIHARFLTEPPWAPLAELGLLAAAALFAALALPRVGAVWGTVLCGSSSALILGLGTYFFMKGDWVKVTYPCSLMTLGYLVLLFKRSLTCESAAESPRKRRAVEAPAPERPEPTAQATPVVEGEAAVVESIPSLEPGGPAKEPQ
ncbi:MAG: CHASE2 domain-containing protein [Elusimicrobia bacterium]|nr:CHASE2 domain-containing protein [Elusimicrobiota bacterium]